jgi:hypothetical protein
VYRTLLRAYPPRFRTAFSDEMVLDLDALVRDHGPLRAWTRTLLDLAVTVPRYRLESMMVPRLTGPVLAFAVTTMIAIGFVSVMVINVAIGGVLIPLGIGLAWAQRSPLARATRPPDPDRRRRLLRRAAVLGVVCVVATTAAWVELSISENWHGGKLALYNAVFFVTAVGALVCLVAGLRTPRARPLTR